MLSLAIVFLTAVQQTNAGQDFMSSWGNNDPLIDQYGKHALCLEAKSYYVNASDERSQTCPKNKCGYESWKNAQYQDVKFSNNIQYALRRIPHQEAQKYLYLPTANVERSTNSGVQGKSNEIHSRKVVGAPVMYCYKINACVIMG